MTVSHIQDLLRKADAQEFAALERSLSADSRKGVRRALDVARRRLEAAAREEERLEGLYAFEDGLARDHGARIVVGLDEVGRGSIAGPLAAGAVVLDRSQRIAGLNDSKQMKPREREAVAAEVKRSARAWAVAYVEAGFIDAHGMAAALRRAFADALAQVEAQGIEADLVLLDGNPLRFDPREANVVHGDARCASIAAASVVAKVDRDALMCDLAQRYPAYQWQDCKGYASAAHVRAIRELGLTPQHRASFCTAFMQETLF